MELLMQTKPNMNTIRSYNDIEECKNKDEILEYFRLFYNASYRNCLEFSLHKLSPMNMFIKCTRLFLTNDQKRQIETILLKRDISLDDFLNGLDVMPLEQIKFNGW